MAYLDPGTGNFLIQLLIGGAVGIGIAIKVFWAQIVGLFSSKKKMSSESDEPEVDEHMAIKTEDISDAS